MTFCELTLAEGLRPQVMSAMCTQNTMQRHKQNNVIHFSNVPKVMLFISLLELKNVFQYGQTLKPTAKYIGLFVLYFCIDFIHQN